MAFRTDQILWYNPPGSVWGELGYASPNFGDDTHTLNGAIAYLVDVIGRNLSAVMHHTDVDLRIPPSINTLQRVHKLVIRGRSILASRAVPSNKLRMEPTHATPAAEPFMIYPVPFWKARNKWLREWCELVLMLIGECCQHTENRLEFEISLDFSAVCGQYLQRIYVRLATELLQIPLADAEKPDFTISDAQFAAYNPSKFFTLTELIDTVPPIGRIPTEDDLRLLTDGIPANLLVGLQEWPIGLSPAEVRLGNTGGSSAGSGTGGGAAFAAPPGV